MIDVLFFSRITFSFFEATAVHCASDAATMVAYVGVLCWQWNGKPFPRTLANKITEAGEICGASREEQNIKRMRACISLILLSLDAPGMSTNHRVRRPGARRSEDARRPSAGARRSFFDNNGSASPAEDTLGLVPLTGGRRAVLPSMHGRLFTAPLTREALHAKRRAAAERAVQGVLKVAFCSFLDQLPPRLPPRPSTNPTLSHPSSRKTRSCLLRSCCSSPMRPHFLYNDANYGVDFLNTTTYVSLLSMDCAWFVSRLHHTFITRANPKTLRGLAHALSESAFPLREP